MLMQLIGWAVFCLPFLFVYRLLCKLQSGDRSYGPSYGDTGAVPGPGDHV